MRTLESLVRASFRMGQELEPLMRRVGQGKALEIAGVLNEELREELADKQRGVHQSDGTYTPVEHVSIAALRTYIASGRTQPAGKRNAAATSPPGGRRGPRVRWPEHLVRVLAQLMDDTTWARLKIASELYESKATTRSPGPVERGTGTRSLPLLSLKQLRAMQSRVEKLARMIRTTIDRRRGSAT